jgi:hypothetical protein
MQGTRGREARGQLTTRCSHCCTHPAFTFHLAFFIQPISPIQLPFTTGYETVALLLVFTSLLASLRQPTLRSLSTLFHST